ncbi:unnamed protein product, partial [Symbiodinium sp. KB8]
DRVLCNGRAGMVFGKPARAACVRISVSVMYEDGTVKDERVANLQLLEDVLEDEPREEEPPLPVQEEPSELPPARAQVPDLFQDSAPPEPDVDETVM